MNPASNIDTTDSNNQGNTSNNISNMATTRSIKVHFEGASRDLILPTPVTLTDLQALVASTFGVELQPRSGMVGAESDVSFKYRDQDGDDIVFDKDHELNLALRLCPSPLEIAATRKHKEPTKPADSDRLYRVAARNLREYHGVPSMTPAKVVKTLTLLQLHPRRLVRQGLAPQKLLADAKPILPLGSGGDTNDDLAEAVTADMVLMNFEDDKKEWNDGFVSVDDERKERAGDTEAAPAPSSAEQTPVVESDDSSAKEDATKKIRNVIHSALVAADIKLRPREVSPLLLALGVRPCRLARLGVVDRKELGAMMEARKRRGGRHSHPRGKGPAGAGSALPSSSGGCGPRAGGARSGAGGGACGRARLCGPGGKPSGPMRRHGGPPMGGMFFVPASYPGTVMRAGAGPGAGGHRGPHTRHFMREGGGLVGVPPGMVLVRRGPACAPRRMNGGGPGGRQQRGHYCG